MEEQTERRMNRELRVAIQMFSQAARSLADAANKYINNSIDGCYAEFGPDEADIGHRYYQDAVELLELADSVDNYLAEILRCRPSDLVPDILEEYLVGQLRKRWEDDRRD